MNTITDLVTQLNSATQALKDHRQDCATKTRRVRELESKLALLKGDVLSRETEINSLFEPSDVETAKTELLKATESVKSCEKAIENLQNFLKITSVSISSNISGQISELKKEIFDAKNDELLEQLSLTDEQISLLKEFVVINQLAPRRDSYGYYIGSAFGARYGELRGDEWKSVKNGLLEKMGFPPESMN
ncbi:hypothetical protein [Vibrio quintilis]|uniref:Chromosome partition protein Smc n=1 Tax=Vibrio quintilis TaxID=1117707 RepID=A0A1M7YR00_9VIBR|nr:hypothetical protein [Vibrio quintilis]SHO55020.1 hypothetical protein VQ7734_00739 [Vibrio quintilis]